VKAILDNIRIVLVRTGKPGNIGAVARAMRNMGLSDLWLVAPRCDHLSHESKRQSTRGEPILHAAYVVEDLSPTLENVRYTIGTSVRGGVYREQIEVTPWRMAAEACEHAKGGKVAILFGPEDTGLRSEEVLRCDVVVRIPANPAYPSLNLAQSMMICAYELYLAATQTVRHTGAERHEDQPNSRNGRELVEGRFRGAGPPEPADAATMHQLMAKLETALVRIGYLRPEHPEHLLFPIRAILSRARLSQTEAQILIGLAQQIQEFAAGNRQ